jgi:PAS domain S-box-containing protein/putative nucleotidyltransferase with HDIG domain
MEKSDKTNKQQLTELEQLRQRVTRLERANSELKGAVEEFRESREDLEAIFNDVRDGIILLDLTGKIIKINKRITEATGYTEKEIVGNRFKFLKMFTANSMIKMITSFAKTVSGHPPPPYEVEGYIKTGEKRIAEIQSYQLKKRGKTVGAVAVIRDITERKQAEVELRESEEKYRTFFERAGFAISLFDAETGERVAFNTMAHKSLGYTREEFQKGTVGDITINRDSEKRREHFKNIIKNGSDLYELQLVAKNGEVRDELISAIPIRMHGRDFIQMIRVDITDHKRADKELKASVVRLKQSLDSTISALASALELRDPYTAGHQQRVTDLACAIAEEMGLPEEQIDGIRMAGLIHDIGKINIPAEILNKPGQLTEIEYSLFKNHPQVGHDVLQNVEFPWPVAQIVLQHHERMDGSGYPQALSGDEIMLEARILAVADIVEAIASHRPYRPARGAGDALEEILHNKGTLYDSEVVDACLRVFYEKGFTFEKFLKVLPVPRIH